MKLKKLITIACGVSMAISACKKDESLASNLVKDIDGNVYKTVTIGTQTWMVENLKTTKYNDGIPILNITDYEKWSHITTGAQCDFYNDASQSTTYGKLYNWYAINTGKLCPKGWHVPSDAEWTILEKYLIANGYNYDGSLVYNYIAKAMAATKYWNSSNTIGAVGNILSTNNKSGFTALPGGYRYFDGAFCDIGRYGYWWSSTEVYNESKAICRCLFSENLDLETKYGYKVVGLSVRCLKD